MLAASHHHSRRIAALSLVGRNRRLPVRIDAPFVGISPAAQKPKPRAAAAKPAKARPPVPPKPVPTTLIKAAQTPTTAPGNVEAPAPTTASLLVKTPRDRERS